MAGSLAQVLVVDPLFAFREKLSVPRLFPGSMMHGAPGAESVLNNCGRTVF
jgi:hypothetical protein